ncbi:MAG TPA: hypothetical protein VFP84_10290 [Kofleriaceae bacterium]|nr:hypothetical protein [Kofleriaceae bacterium]
MALALVACNAAGADPAPPGALPGSPASWKALPAIASAVSQAAAADGVTVDATDAWGDPALGCFAVRLALHGGAASNDALVDQVLAGLASKPGGLTFSELVKPTPTGDVLAFSFARAPYRGRVRAKLAAGKITALACFGNQRAPAGCETTCGHMLQGAP